MQEFIEGKAQRYPALVQLQELGKSYQGRKMRLVKISTRPNAKNPIIFVDAGKLPTTYLTLLYLRLP